MSDVISFNQAKSKMLTSVFHAETQQTCCFQSCDEGTQPCHLRTFDVSFCFIPQFLAIPFL